MTDGSTHAAGPADNPGSAPAAGSAHAAEPTHVAELARAVELAHAAELVLLDLDGPVARLFPGDTWLEVSAQVRALAARHGDEALVEALGDEPDHVQCLRVVGALAPHLLPQLSAPCTDLELQAARRVRPPEHALAFIEQALDRGSLVAVVTNNDPGVVPLLLEPVRPGLSSLLLGVYGRSPDRVDDLKPAPDLLRAALADGGADPARSLFLGDSVTDVEAGLAAGVVVVGVADDAGRRAQLLDAGAVAAVPDLGWLLEREDSTAPEATS